MRVLMVDDSPHSHLLSTKIILKRLESTLDTKREVKLSNYSELVMHAGWGQILDTSRIDG